jgi:hypothetical protein
MKTISGTKLKHLPSNRRDKLQNKGSLIYEMELLKGMGPAELASSFDITHEEI